MFRIVIHGGAGVISKSLDASDFICALKRILVDTYSYARNENCSAVDIVEYAVKQLEDEPLFNAGRGAVFTHDITHELESSIMDGETLRCGAVSLIKHLKNPISAARTVMIHTDHNYMIGDAAEVLAMRHGLETVDNSYFTTPRRLEQINEALALAVVANDHDLEKPTESAVQCQHPGSTGTVGCVCVKNGHVAAATSTGGMTNKLSGRIGDTPIIGAGTYANDNTCAVSATGKGEDFMRHVASHHVSCLMEIGGRGLGDAVRETVQHKLPRESGGVIAVDAAGNYAMEFNCPGMFRGTVDEQGSASVGVWEDSVDFIVPLL